MKTHKTVQMALTAMAAWLFFASMAGAAETEERGRADNANESIVVEPRVPPPPPRPRPPDYGFDVDIWTDRRAYEVGDLIRVNFRVTRPCYVYIFDTDTRGRTHQLFPNYYDRDNHVVPRRTYYIPDRNYRLRVTGPTGTETIRIVAVRERATIYERRYRLEPGDPFPAWPEGTKGFLREYRREHGGAEIRREGREEERSPAPAKRAERAGENAAETIVVEPGNEPRTIVVEPDYYDRDYAEAYTTVRVTDPYYEERPPLVFGKLDIESSPRGARVTIDGVRRGYTPLTLPRVDPGYHEIAVSLPGYVSWSQSIEVPEDRTVRIDVRLRRYEPRPWFEFRLGR